MTSPLTDNLQGWGTAVGAFAAIGAFIFADVPDDTWGRFIEPADKVLETSRDLANRHDATRKVQVPRHRAPPAAFDPAPIWGASDTGRPAPGAFSKDANEAHGP